MLNNIMDWLDDRIPLKKVWNEHFAEYYAPKNFNIWYFFGSLALVVLVNQLLTGVCLTMHYTPTGKEAFASVEYIMRDVPYGWILRYLHSTGASAFFIIMYLHIFRGLIYGSYKKPRELVWLIGVLIFLALLAEAFMGYLLPWGQMSFWGAQVITSLFSAIPYIGDGLALWLRGDFNVSEATLHRFFALHVALIPLFIFALVYLHIVALHAVGSNNPEGIEIKKHKNPQGKPLDGIPFHPYYTVKDLFGLGVFLILFLGVVFFKPDFFGFFLEPDNFLPADSLTTPEHIMPVWYMTPFYSILRAIPNKFLGVLGMGAAILVLFFLPWLDKVPVKSIRYRGAWYRTAIALFVIAFIGLGYLGVKEVTPFRQFLAQLYSFIYFGFFLFMPIYTRIDPVRIPPERIK